MLMFFRYLGKICLGKLGCFWLRLIVMILKWIGVIFFKNNKIFSMV